MTYLVRLYQEMVKILGEVRYKNNNIAAQRRAFFLVTHMDMIPTKERRDFKQQTRKQFMHHGIPEDSVIFGEKECEYYNPPTHCIRGGCKHQLTEDTISFYWQYLKAMLESGCV